MTAVNLLLLAVCYISATLGCPVYITVSPLESWSKDATVIINLGPGCTDPPDWVGLYRQNPSLSKEPPLAFVSTNGTTMKHFPTDVVLGKLQLPWGWDEEDVNKNPPKRGKSICLNLFVASYKNNKLQMLDCLKIQPAWMSLDNDVRSVAFKNFFIPGTHCSACYKTKSNQKNQVLNKFGFYQNVDIWHQLVFGVRYLDFSVGYQQNQNNSKDFWVMNGSLKISPLINVLREIRKFVIFSHEPVFLDFHNFPIGFHKHPERHNMLVKVLLQEMGDILYSKDAHNNFMNTYDLSLDMLKRNTLMLMYNEPAMLKEFKQLWPSWKRYSSEFLKPVEVNEYMKNLFSKKSKDSPKGIGWIFMGVQGIESSYDPNENLKSPGERADEINPRVVPLLGGPWGWNANVVAVDYVMSSNLIDIALHASMNKLMSQKRNSNMTVVDI